MKYDQLKKIGEDKFRRLTGVKRSTFIRMLEILRHADKDKRLRGGRKNKLSLEDQLFLALEYIRSIERIFT